MVGERGISQYSSPFISNCSIEQYESKLTEAAKKKKKERVKPNK